MKSMGYAHPREQSSLNWDWSPFPPESRWSSDSERPPLPSSQCQSLSHQGSDVPFDSAFLTLLLLPCVLTGKLPGLEMPAVGMVPPSR